MTSSLRALNKHPLAKAIDMILDNQNSSAIPKIPRMIQNADFKPEPISLDEAVAIIVHHNLSAEVYRQLTKRVNEKIKNLNWELEKFHVRLEFQFGIMIRLKRLNRFSVLTAAKPCFLAL